MKYLLILFLFFGYLTGNAQDQYVHEFYIDARKYNKEVNEFTFKFTVSSLLITNSKTSVINDTTYLIAIDRHFYASFAKKTQLKRLVYHELGHILLHLYDSYSSNDIMNVSTMYKPLRKRHIKKLFASEINDFNLIEYSDIEL